MFEYLGSDGDAPRRQALTQFCTARNLREQYGAWKSQYDAASVGDPKPEKPRAVKIYEAVFEAVLFDYSTGPQRQRHIDFSKRRTVLSSFGRCRTE